MNAASGVVKLACHQSRLSAVHISGLLVGCIVRSICTPGRGCTVLALLQSCWGVKAQRLLVSTMCNADRHCLGFQQSQLSLARALGCR